jgi:glycosyltransferase involved in cell wall biosynthesis
MKYFILVPSFTPCGPVKGAIAFANAIVDKREIVLVAVKKGAGVLSCLSPKVHTIDLSDISSNLIGRLIAYKNLLRHAGRKSEVVSISICFLADLFNAFCSRHSITLSSVRGNLPQNYKFEYGFSGIILAYFHFYLLRYIDTITVMSKSMSRQISKYISSEPIVIGNFIDEDTINLHRVNRKINTGKLRFAFVGSLTERKQPELLIRAIRELKNMNYDVSLDIIGDGPQRSSLKKCATNLGLGNVVIFHGFLKDPCCIVVQVDSMVLPSISEGISRSSLEALYLNVPCVLRDVDGNPELINNCCNGFLFLNENDLPDAMLKAALLCRSGKSKLLPEAFQQENCVNSYMNLIENK